jgi:hypothetical protein
MRRLIILATLLGVVISAVACSGGSSGPTLTPVAGNTQLVVGPNRMAIALIDNDTNEPVLAAEGTSVVLTFSFDDEEKFERDARFIWAIEDSDGFWAADVEFDQEGTWATKATLTRDGEESSVSFTYPVFADTDVPFVGDQVPATDNPTVETEPEIRQLTTDDEPDLDFYQLTVADALEQEKPFVVVFATPLFCTTQFCGPVLDNVKAVKPEFEDQVNFIHIEPYALDDEGQLMASTGGGPQTAPATDAWHLISEPWVFIVDADGRVAARFESAVSQEEVRQALEAVVS